ncbi:MAG: HEAT repeat domain-containing protein [Treponema sp.]|jgi:HEAT repeat protein|nr:HEAT repeat domain-containing protein [Treponema sp.]
MKKIFFVMTLLIGAVLYAQDESGAAQSNNSTEQVRYNTVKYGTETEIVNLIQTLKTEGADYLDQEITALVENTRNQKILAGAFSFFGEREKSGLEDRAMRAIEERGEEKNETVLAAIDYLGKVKAEKAAPVLRKLIESSEKRFINAALRSFGRISGGGRADDAAEYLVDFYENNSPDDENRREIITALGAAGSAGAVQFLAGIASNSEERAGLRTAALESIAKIGAGSEVADKAGLDAILACVSAGDPNLRSAAVTALGPFSGQAVDQAILDAFRDSYYRTRIAAAQASRQRKLAAAVPYLKFRAERDEVPAVKEDSIRALGAIADSESVKILEDLFIERKNNDRVRIVAGEMIMQLQPEKFLDRFVMELDEAKQKKQTALYNGLLKIIGETKSANMETVTRRLMQNSGVIERSYALDMAVNNRLAGLADEIRAITTDKNESLAAKARRTLEKLGLP